MQEPWDRFVGEHKPDAGEVERGDEERRKRMRGGVERKEGES